MATSLRRKATRSGINATSNAVHRRIQTAANARGHGNRTAGATTLGAFGAAVGSFGGPLGALLGGAAGAWLGAVIGDELDRGGQ